MTNTFVDLSLLGDKISRNLKRSSFIILTAALVISGFFIVSVNSVMAETRNVPGDYLTIQAAIDAATTSDTIIVAAGTYYGGINSKWAIYIDKPITLLGAQAGVDARSRSGAETIIDATGYGVGIYVVGEGDHTVIDGFEVKNSGYVDERGAGIGLEDGADYVTIRNTYVHNNNNQGIQSFLRTSGYQINNHILIEKCRLEDNGDSGVKAYGSSYVTVQDNLIRNNEDYGVLVWDYRTVTGYVLDDVQILRNHFSNNGDNVKLDGGETSGIITNAVVAFNEIRSGQRGVYLRHNVASVQVYDNEFADNDVQVYDNPEVLDIGDVLANNTFDRAVTVDHPGDSLLPTIWSKIRDAVDAATDGDTINVADGTYDETIDIDKRITLQGVGSDVTGTVLQSTINPTVVVGVTYQYKPVVILSASGIAGNPILLKDLRIQLRQDLISGQLPGILPRPGDPISYVELNNVHIFGTNSEGTAESGLTIDGSASLNHLLVSNCEFRNMAYGMIFYNESGSMTTAQNIEVSGTVFDNNSIKGFYAEKLSEATFNNVTVTGSGDPALSPDWADPWNAGIDINLKFGDYQNLEFNNLTITNNGIGSTNGIGFTVKARGTGSDSSYSSDPATLDGVTVNEGTFAGNEAGVRFGEPGKDNASPTNITVRNASIFGNTQFGLGNELSGITVDAANNWWDSENGPTHSSNTYNIDSQGDIVSDNVNFTPWLDALEGNSFSPVKIGEAGYPSIQSAIDAATTSDTINVAAGTYDEYVDIDKSLTLSGQFGAIVKPSTSPDEPIIGINADGVTVEGFEVDGMGLTVVWAGIGTWDGCTNVTIQDNIVHDILNDPAGNANSGLGIGLWRGGDGNIFEDILIEGNTIYNTDRMGIYIGAINQTYDAWLLSDNITIRDNEVYNTMLNPNEGETFPGGCGGIAIDAAKGSTVEENTVYDTANTMPGIFLAHGSGPGNQISGNEVHDQAYGIAVDINRGDVDFGEDSSTAPEVHSNNIHDSGGYGLIVLNADEKVVDASNNWWGSENGPTHTSNTYNIDSQGDIVSDNINFTPWLDAPEGNSFSPVKIGEAGYLSIQAAIDAATTSDTVNAAAGTYDESVIINKNNLTILGDSDSRPEITGGLKLDTDLTGLTFRNFYVTGIVDPSKNSVVRMYGSITDLTIDNCVFDGENVPSRMGFTGGQIEGDLTVTNSEFKNIAGWAVLDTRSGSGGDGSAMGTVTFAHNNIHDCNGSIVFRGLSTDWTDNVYVYENTFENIGEVGISEHWAAFEVNRANNVEIHNNEIRNVVECSWGEGQAMQLWKVGVVDIYANTIENNYMGIYILKWPADETYDISGILIYQNSFLGNNQYALSVEDGLTGGPVNTTNNWWGSAKPVFNTIVSGNVNYSPWYANQEMTSLAGTPDENNKLTLPTEAEINVTTSVGEVKVKMPAGLTVTGEEGWTGEIKTPEVKSNSSVTVIPERRKTATVSAVIEIGYGDVKLTFDKAVRISIAGQAGKYVGYSRMGIFTPITTICTADTQDVGNALPAEGDCKIDVWPDLVIWTKHFTKFIAYTQTAIVPGGGGTTGIDTIAPSISAISVVTRSNSATISWQTNESSLTWIVYGTSTDYGEESKTTSYTTSHSVTLSELSPETTYHYQIKSKDSNGNMGSYTDKTFTTSALEEKITGDINGDNKVDIADFNLLIVNWGDSPSNLAADLDGNDKVDIFDFNLLMINWW